MPMKPETRKAWRARNKEKLARYRKEFKERNPEKVKAEAAAYRKANPEKWAEYAKKYRAKKRDERNAIRPTICEVCKTKGPTVYDHCHEFGHFRGWLCNGCNTALGLARDNPETLRNLADYLERDWYKSA